MVFRMDSDQFVELTAWITEAGLAGQAKTATLTGFCERALALSLPLARANVVIDTLHPIYEGRAFTWKQKRKETVLTEFGRSDERLDLWERSPFYRLELTGVSFLRRRLSAETGAEFSYFPSTGRRNDRLYSDNESVRRRRNHRRHGLRLLVVGDGCAARLPRLRYRRTIPAYARGRAYAKIRVLDAHRRNLG